MYIGFLHYYIIIYLLYVSICVNYIDIKVYGYRKILYGRYYGKYIENIRKIIYKKPSASRCRRRDGRAAFMQPTVCHVDALRQPITCALLKCWKGKDTNEERYHWKEAGDDPDF